MRRYVVRFRGKGKPPPEAVQRLRALTQVVDEFGGRAFSVDADDSVMETFAAPDWAVSVEQEAMLPDSRPQILRTP